jgi:hypothetical protein
VQIRALIGSVLRANQQLLVLLIAVIPAWMPNLASAIAIDVGDLVLTGSICDGTGSGGSGVINC